MSIDMTLQKWSIFIMGVYGEISHFCRIKLKFRIWLYKKRWHTSWKFQLKIRSNTKSYRQKTFEQYMYLCRELLLQFWKDFKHCNLHTSYVLDQVFQCKTWILSRSFRPWWICCPLTVQRWIKLCVPETQGSR